MAWQPVVRAHEPGMAPPPIAPAEWVTEVQTLQELVPMAHENLAKEHWDYLVGGSETETTVKRNRLAIEEIGLRPRVLRRVPYLSSSDSHDVVFFVAQKAGAPPRSRTWWRRR